MAIDWEGLEDNANDVESVSSNYKSSSRLPNMIESRFLNKISFHLSLVFLDTLVQTTFLNGIRQGLGILLKQKTLGRNKIIKPTNTQKTIKTPQNPLKTKTQCPFSEKCFFFTPVNYGILACHWLKKIILASTTGSLLLGEI